ncbi:MAG: AAA family ATPase [Deltaproteobacteria bacterium]|nr:AAA family ATPase [Deltaproteobacteria bacterium]
MEGEQMFSFGPYRLDPTIRQLWRGTQLVKLTPKALAVLRVLASRPGQVVTKDDLFQAVWAGTVVSDTALTSCIKELRQALRDDARKPRYLETVHRRGYRFIGQVISDQLSVVSPPPAALPRSPLATGNWQLATHLVGREAELGQLHEWWDKALQGERQLVFVTGEPGIGKTALVERFLADIGAHGDAPGGDRAAWIGRGQCIEHYGAGEAYLAVLEALGRLCCGAEGERVIVVLRKHAPMWLVQLPAFIDGAEEEALQRKVQGASRERMLRELAEALEVLTAEQPLILRLEDLHWSDVSTLDGLALLARRNEMARLLVIGTYRPVEVANEGHPLRSHLQELAAHQLCAELALGPLREADIEEYLATRFAGGEHGRAPLQSLAHTLHQHTDGNPLFFVSLVDDLVTRGVLTHTDEGWTLREDGGAVGVPETIRQLVARQRERLLPEEQRVLEAASVTGMEFSAAAIAAALAVDTAAVERNCERLAERQQFLQRVGIEEWPDGTAAARYSFLHALYQHLWHERVSPTQLQHLHLQIGERKERAYEDRTREIAAELAVHFEQGRDYRRAIQYLQQAAEKSLRRSANQEAVSHLTKALDFLTTLPDTSERTHQELALLITLGAPLIATKGYGTLEVETVYTRARELCQQLEETPQIFSVLFGLRAVYVAQGDYQTARGLAEQCLRLAQSVQDATLLLLAHMGLGTTLYFLGAFAEAREHLEQALAYYDRQQHNPHVSRTPQDPRVICLTYLAWVLWTLGYPEQAVKKEPEALTLAQELSHPFSLAWALNLAAKVHLWRREGSVVQERAEAMILLATEHGFPYWLTEGTMLQGWALAEQGQEEEGFTQMRHGLTTWRAIGSGVAASYFLTLPVEAYGRRGQVEQGLTVLAEALAMVDRTGERFYEAELYRLKGELSLQSEVRSPKSKIQRLEEKPKAKGKAQKAKITSLQSLTPNPQAEAEACFLQAIEIARQQQAKSLELRAVMSLSRLWQQQDKK